MTICGKLLGVPVTNAEGNHLKYVSPRQVRDADAFRKHASELLTRRDQAANEGVEFQPTTLDNKVNELIQAMGLFREVAVSPVADAEAAHNFSQQLRATAQTWAKIDEDMQLFSQGGQEAGGLDEVVLRARGSLEQLGAWHDRVDIEPAKVVPIAAQFEQSTAQLARQFAEFQQRLQTAPPAGWNEEQLKNGCNKLAELAWQTKQLASDVRGIGPALFKNAKLLRVVPALNAAALEKDRDVEDRRSRGSIWKHSLTGSPEVLSGYPAADLERVRTAWSRLGQVYPEARPPQRFCRRCWAILSTALRGRAPRRAARAQSDRGQGCQSHQIHQLSPARVDRNRGARQLVAALSMVVGDQPGGSFARLGYS